MSDIDMMFNPGDRITFTDRVLDREAGRCVTRTSGVVVRYLEWGIFDGTQGPYHEWIVEILLDGDRYSRDVTEGFLKKEGAEAP